MSDDPDLTDRQRARIRRDHDEIVARESLVTLLRSPDRQRCVHARITLMMALTLLQEAMWGLVQHQVTPVAFAATWSSHTSYWQYGLDYFAQARRLVAKQSTQDALKLVRTCRVWPAE